MERKFLYEWLNFCLYFIWLWFWYLKQLCKLALIRFNLSGLQFNIFHVLFVFLYFFIFHLNLQYIFIVFVYLMFMLYLFKTFTCCLTNFTIICLVLAKNHVLHFEFQYGICMYNVINYLKITIMKFGRI